jgi:hypothetical protein
MRFNRLTPTPRPSSLRAEWEECAGHQAKRASKFGEPAQLTPAGSGMGFGHFAARTLKP